MAERDELLYCEKCKKTMRADQFYGTNNLEKYPTGKLNICKKCLTMHVDNFKPDTYLWILQECDVPYVPDEWNKLLAKYGKSPKATGMTIIGRYLSAMRLTQYCDYRWKDSEYLQEVADKKTKEAMKRQGFSASEIDKTITENRVVIPEGPIEQPEYKDREESIEDYFSIQSGGSDDFETELTEEDKIYLRIKWGKSYKAEEWVKLEDLYNKMMESYDVQGAGHEDILKMVCKTSLKSNQLLDIGDVDGAQKMVKMYDSLMKSGNFTAAQNKKENGEYVDSISEFVMICEKDGYIERYYVEQPKDRVDETILDLKEYTQSLVTEEMNLGNLIENAVKEMMREENKEEDEDFDDEDELSLEELDGLKYEDFEEYNNFIEDEMSADEDAIMAFQKGEI